MRISINLRRRIAIEKLQRVLVRCVSKNGAGFILDDFVFRGCDHNSSNTVLAEPFKAPLPLFSLGTNSELEITVAALRLRDADEIFIKK